MPAISGLLESESMNSIGTHKVRGRKKSLGLDDRHNCKYHGCDSLEERILKHVHCILFFLKVRIVLEQFPRKKNLSYCRVAGQFTISLHTTLEQDKPM